MSHLIPQQRMDKNGHLVVRHVKPGLPSPAPSAIPSPMLGGITLSSDASNVMEIWNNSRIASTHHTLDDFNPEAVAEVDRLIAESRRLGRTMGLQASIVQAFGLMADEGIATDFHNIAVFGGHILAEANIDVGTYVIALQEMNAPDHVDYLLDATPEQRYSAEALVRFTAKAEHLELAEELLWYSSEDEEEILEYTRVRDPELTAFILDNPDSVDDLLDLLKVSPKALPVELIREQLSHGEKALRVGVL